MDYAYLLLTPFFLLVGAGVVWSVNYLLQLATDHRQH